MKQPQNKLGFRKESIIELTDSKLQYVKGGTGIPSELTTAYLTSYFGPPVIKK